MAIYIPLFAIASWSLVEGYESWHAFNAHSAVALGNLLLFAALLLHGWVGVRDIIIDYLKPTAVRVTALTLLAVSLGVMTLWVLRIYVGLTL